jgi:molybdate transport system regulatory protein
MGRPQPDLAEALGHDATDKRIDILRRIGEVGSISEAARGAGVSYKAAWQALETLSNLAGAELVAKVVGGSGGGGAVLTDAGRRVLEAATLLSRARAQVLSRYERGADGRGTPGAAALALRTSMRNQFPCTVGTLARREGLVRVALQLPGGATLFSRITRESAQLLGLRRGVPVLALCKATAVRVAARIEPAGPCNVLRGTVTRVSRPASGGEVTLQIDGGPQLVGFAGRGHGLRRGDAAMAGVDETGVVVAIPR